MHDFGRPELVPPPPSKVVHSATDINLPAALFSRSRALFLYKLFNGLLTSGKDQSLSDRLAHDVYGGPPPAMHTPTKTFIVQEVSTKSSASQFAGCGF